MTMIREHNVAEVVAAYTILRTTDTLWATEGGIDRAIDYMFEPSMSLEAGV